jgi:ribosomal protein S12 methylthiotransferase accessory factor
LELSCAGDPAVDETIELLTHRGFRLAAWDITTDVSVPSFHCVIADDLEPGGQPGTGTGCHPDKRVALMRALFEAIQVRATYISGGRDDLVRRDYDKDRIAVVNRMLGDDGLRSLDVRRFLDIPSRETAYFEDDLIWTMAELDKAGCEPPVVVDLSQEGTGISVVRVIVPGLEGPLAKNALPGPRALRVSQ